MSRIYLIQKVFIIALFAGISFSCSSDDPMEEIVENIPPDDTDDDGNDGGDDDGNDDGGGDGGGTTNPIIYLADILTGEYTTCTSEGTNPSRGTDIANPVNVGSMDDRTCYSDYYEVEVGDETWGAYNITHESNHMDTNGLQPRMERALSRTTNINVGGYAHFTGTVRILEVAHTNVDGSTGTYIMQAKGKHTGGGGSADPAICLYLAKPVFGDTEETKDEQVSFDIWREQINVRGGSGTGRDLVFLTNIPKGQVTNIELKVGFRADPTDASKKIHYADAIIGDEEFNWNIPEPDRATESKIRYGAYRVKGGRAQIRWANTTYQKN